MLTVWRLCLSVLILWSQRQRWKNQIALDVPNLFVLLSQEKHLALPWAVSRAGSANHNPIQPSFLASDILELKLITVRTNQGFWLHLLGQRFQNACSCLLVFFFHTLFHDRLCIGEVVRLIWHTYTIMERALTANRNSLCEQVLLPGLGRGQPTHYSLM